MGACISSEGIDDDDLKRWQEKKKSTKGACVPKVDYTKMAMSNDLKKMGNRIATHKKYEKAKSQDENRLKLEEEKRKSDASRAHTSTAEEVLWVPHKGLATYKELSEEFGSKNKKALVRMASEAHLKKSNSANYSSGASTAERAANANKKLNRSKSTRG